MPRKPRNSPNPPGRPKTDRVHITTTLKASCVRTLEAMAPGRTVGAIVRQLAESIADGTIEASILELTTPISALGPSISGAPPECESIPAGKTQPSGRRSR